MGWLDDIQNMYKAADEGNTEAQEQTYGTSLGKFSSESDLFTKISGDLIKGTQKETYDDFFKFKTSIKEREILDSTSTAGTTKSGQVRGFAGSTADSSDIQNRKDLYAGSVVDTEMEIQNKVSSARDSINSIIAGNKSTLLTLKQMEQSKPKKKKCCFIMLEVENSDSLDPYVRKYRDEMLNEYNYKGYYKLAEVVVPLMRKSKLVKWFFYLTFVYPAKSWAYTHYTGKGLGFLFSPLRPLWLNLFEYLGKDHKLRSEDVV